MNIPHVIRELPFTKNCKMVYIIGIIVIGLLLFITYYNKPISIKQSATNKIILKSDSMLDMNYPTTILASNIILSNLNKFNIPVKEISVIDNNKKLIYVKPSKVVYDKGITIYFALPYNIQISEIVIDNNILSKHTNNITTTQVIIRDNNDKVLWTNNKPLPGGIRYISLPITTQKLIYPDTHYLQVDDCKEFGECQLKKILNTQ